MTSKTLTVACCAFALAAAEEQGRLLGVRARVDAKASVVEIDGDRPLSFTTMKLLSPPRVVVDFADTEVAAEQRELEIDDGTLRRAALAQAGSRTARVVIELSVDAEFDVRAEGNRVEVRVPRPGAVAEAEPEGQGAGDAEAEKVASLPKISLVGSKPAQPPEDGRTDRQRAAFSALFSVQFPKGHPASNAPCDPDAFCGVGHVSGLGKATVTIIDDTFDEIPDSPCLAVTRVEQIDLEDGSGGLVLESAGTFCRPGGAGDSNAGPSSYGSPGRFDLAFTANGAESTGVFVAGCVPEDKRPHWKAYEERV